MMAAPVGAPDEPTSDPRSDLDLIAAINDGDAGAFEILYYRHRDWVVNLAFRFTGDRDLALDVLQEVFLYFVKKFPGFRLTASLKTFFYPAVKNLSIAARRKAGRVQSTAEEQAVIEGAPSTDPPPAREEALNIALGALSDEHCEVLLLRFVDDLSLAEVAESLGVPLGTVKSRLHYALDTLRRDRRTRTLFDP